MVAFLDVAVGSLVVITLLILIVLVVLLVGAASFYAKVKGEVHTLNLKIKELDKYAAAFYEKISELEKYAQELFAFLRTLFPDLP